MKNWLPRGAELKEQTLDRIAGGASCSACLKRKLYWLGIEDASQEIWLSDDAFMANWKNYQHIEEPELSLMMLSVFCVTCRKTLSSTETDDEPGFGGDEARVGHRA